MSEPLSVFHFSDCPILGGIDADCVCAEIYRQYLPEWDDESVAPPLRQIQTVAIPGGEL